MRGIQVSMKNNLPEALHARVAYCVQFKKILIFLKKIGENDDFSGGARSDREKRIHLIHLMFLLNIIIHTFNY